MDLYLIFKKKVIKMSTNGNGNLFTNRVFFIFHIFIFLAVNLLLLLIWALTQPGFFWVAFPFFSWGIGVSFHTITYLMFNDKIEILTKIKQQSKFGILFIYHATLYSSVNLLLIVTDLVLQPITFFFLWPLFMWGVGFVLHALGFFTWEKVIENEIEKLKKTHENYSEKRLKAVASSKIVNIWILLIHIAYFILINILIYALLGNTITLSNQIQNTIGWGIILGLHILYYILFFIIKNIEPIVKSWIIHIATYVSINIYLYYRNIVDMIGVTWFHYPLILWGIWVLIYSFMVFKWDKILAPALEKVKSRNIAELEDFEINKKAVSIVFWKLSFISHIPIYIVGVILIGMGLIEAGLQTNYVIIPALGWLIGLAVHGMLFFIISKPITDKLIQTLLIHITVYIFGSILLVVINLLTFPSFLWSSIAMGGWGIGLGFHVMIWFLKKPQKS